MTTELPLEKLHDTIRTVFQERFDNKVLTDYNQAKRMTRLLLSYKGVTQRCIADAANCLPRWLSCWLRLDDPNYMRVGERMLVWYNRHLTEERPAPEPVDPETTKSWLGHPSLKKSFHEIVRLAIRLKFEGEALATHEDARMLTKYLLDGKYVARRELIEATNCYPNNFTCWLLSENPNYCRVGQRMLTWYNRHLPRNEPTPEPAEDAVWLTDANLPPEKRRYQTRRLHVMSHLKVADWAALIDEDALFYPSDLKSTLSHYSFNGTVLDPETSWEALREHLQYNPETDIILVHRKTTSASPPVTKSPRKLKFE